MLPSHPQTGAYSWVQLSGRGTQVPCAAPAPQLSGWKSHSSLLRQACPSAPHATGWGPLLATPDEAPLEGGVALLDTSPLLGPALLLVTTWLLDRPLLGRSLVAVEVPVPLLAPEPPDEEPLLLTSWWLLAPPLLDEVFPPSSSPSPGGVGVHPQPASMPAMANPHPE